MPRVVLFLRPSKDMISAAGVAVERFAKIAQTEITVLKQNINQAADAIEAGKIDVIFTATTMERSEANVFMGCIERSKDPPYIIASPENSEKIQISVPNDKLCKAKNDFSEEFIFTCLRNLLTPKNYRFDGRYLRSILKSVVEVINKNTGIALQPSPVTELKPEESTETVVTVVAFYGDGIFGSVSIHTTEPTVRKLGSKILFIPPEQVNTEVALDLLAEVGNQIIGVMRKELADFGWKLNSSLQIVQYGTAFLNRDTAPGTCYKLPFTIEEEKFDIVFRYTTYQVSVQEIEINLDNRLGQVFDVRLLNLANDIFQSALKASFGLESRKQQHQAIQAKPQISQTQYIYHAGGWQGEYTLGIEMSFETAVLLAKRNKIPLEDDKVAESEHQNRIFSAMILKIGQEFNRLARQLGYTFEQVYSGAVYSELGFHYLVRSSGQFVQIPFVVGASYVILTFGLRSDYASSLFDVWPLLSHRTEFRGEKVV
jgi:CheY-specific phosphatase CheX